MSAKHPLISKLDFGWRSERTHKSDLGGDCDTSDFEIDTLEMAENHVHVFLSFPPRYFISKVAGMLKSISASVIFKEHPDAKRELWGGEF